MKTIAILTDFSLGSEHAALYALHLAKKIKADVVLYNLDPFPVPGKLVMASEFPEDEEQDLCVEINERLEAFSSKLENHLIERSFPGSPLPEITYDCDNQEIVDVMTSIVNNNDIILIVTAPLDGQDIAAYMQSEHCRQIMNWSPVPVMIVPHTASIRNPEKIAITTGLGERDTDYINLLVNLMEPFSSEIMVAHLTENHPSENTFTHAEKKFLTNIYANVNYGRIYYRRIIAGGREKGWKWLNDNKKCDLLVIKRQPQNELKKFFSIGRTDQITHHITIPIIVLPEMN